MKFASLRLVLLLAVGTCMWGQADRAKPSAGVASLLAKAGELASANRLAEAEVLYVEAARLAPDDEQVLTELGKVKSRLGEYNEAVELFRKVATEHSASSEAHLNFAIALADSHDLA